MKTTVELDAVLLRRAKAHAAARGISLKQFLSEAVEQRLQTTPRGQPPRWKGLLGGLSSLRKETARIDRAIAEEFEQMQHGLPVVSRDAHFDEVVGVRRVGW